MRNIFRILLLLAVITTSSFESAYAGQLFQNYCLRYRAANKMDNPQNRAKFDIVHFASSYFKKNGSRKFGIQFKIGSANRSEAICKILDQWILGSDELDLSRLPNDTHPGFDDLGGIQEFQHLKVLKIHGHSLNDISHLVNFNNLETLEISGDHPDGEPVRLNLNNNSLEALKHIPNLTKLKISNAMISDISSLYNLSQIVELNLSGNKIEEFDMKEAYIKLKSLTNLNISNNQIRNFKTYLPRNKKLDIDISSNFLSVQPLEMHNISISSESQKEHCTKRDLVYTNSDEYVNLGKSGDLIREDAGNRLTSIDSYCHTLSGAAYSCHFNNFKHLVDNFPGNLELLFQFQEENYETILNSLAKSPKQVSDQKADNCLKIASIILPHMTAESLNYRDQLGHSALYYTVVGNKVPLMNLILQQKPNEDNLLEARDATDDSYLKTALANAVYFPNVVVDQEKIGFRRRISQTVKRLRDKGTDPDLVSLLEGACYNTAFNTECINMLQKSTELNRDAHRSILDMVQSLENSLILTAGERKLIKNLGGRSSDIFEFIQGQIINYFIVSSIIASGKVDIHDDTIISSWKSVLAGGAVTSIKTAGKVFPVMGILPSIGFLAGFGVAALEKEDLEKTRKIYGQPGKVGQGNLFVQGVFAKDFSIEFLKKMDSRSRNVEEADFQDFKDQFRRYFELSMFEEYLNMMKMEEDKLSVDIDESLKRVATKTAICIQHQEDDGFIWEQFKNLPDSMKWVIGKIGKLESFSIHQTGKLIKSFLFEQNIPDQVACF